MKDTVRLSVRLHAPYLSDERVGRNVKQPFRDHLPWGVRRTVDALTASRHRS